MPQAEGENPGSPVTVGHWVPVAEATAWLTTLSARWEQRLLRLKRYVEEES